jgi:diketogulonate reductase-like aldo/keto reductase
MPDNLETTNNIVFAIKNGYRLIDTASRYGNETCVGEAIKKCGLNREELFITSKLWNTDQGYQSTLDAFELTLKKLDLEYLDLYLIHWPVPEGHEHDYQELNKETWRAFEKLYRDGKIKAIGLSNFKIEYIDQLLETAEIIPMVNQIEFHPGAYNKELLQYCSEHNIVVEAWGPLGQGRVFENPILTEIAQKYGKTVSQICLRWCIQHNIIPLPKSSHKERILQNLDVFNFEIDQHDMEKINNNDLFKDTIGSNYYNRK